MTDCSHFCGCSASCQLGCYSIDCRLGCTPTSKEAPKVTSKDPNSWIQASAETLAETLLSKNHDYAPEGEFSNFEKAAEVAGIDALQVIVAQVGIKLTRIQTLMGLLRGSELNESLKDSFLDLAGYALIGHAFLSAQSAQDSRPGGAINPDPLWLVRDEEG